MGIQGILLACESQVHEMQQFSMLEKQGRFQSLALFCFLSLNNSQILTAAAVNQVCLNTHLIYSF